MRTLQLLTLALGSLLAASSNALADSFVFTSLPGIPYGINNSGAIVGVGADGVFLRNPDGSVQWLHVTAAPGFTGYLDFPSIGGVAINDLGQIVWGNGVDEGFLRDPNGTITSFPVPDGSIITGINDSEQVVGTSLTCPTANPCGMIGDVNGAFITFTVEYETYVYGMNNLGQAVGLTHNGEDAFVRNPDGLQGPGIPLGGFPNLVAAYGINDNGLVVGAFAPNGIASVGHIDGFINYPSGVSFIDYPDAERTLLTGINNDNEIIGYADGRGFLGTPVPEPTSLLLFGTPLVYILRRVVQRKKTLQERN